MLKPISLNIIKTRWLLFALISAAILTFNIIGFFWPDYLGSTNHSPIGDSIAGILIFFLTGIFIYCYNLNSAWSHSIPFCAVGTVLHVTGSGPASFIGTIFLIIGLSLCAEAKGHNKAWGLMGFFSFLGVLILLFLQSKNWGKKPNVIDNDLFSLGELPNKKDIFRYALLGIPMVGLSLFCSMVIFIPLSYAYPNFVKDWLFDESMKMIYLDGQIDSTICTILNILLLVIIAPIAEELYFRGYLLNRFNNKFNTIIAVLLSSFLFSLGHVGILGSFIFAALLSLIYLKTKSIYGPVIIHMSNNFLALIFMIISEILYEQTSKDLMLIEFQKSWWIGIFGIIISAPWLFIFIKKNKIFRLVSSSDKNESSVKELKAEGK